MNVFVLLNTKEDILKNVGNRAVLDHSIFSPTMEVNGAPKQPDYKLSSKYLHLCSVVWIYLFCWTQRKIFWRMRETEQFWGIIDYHSIFSPTMEVNGAPKQPGYKLSSKYLPLCSVEQRNSYGFGTTWGWVNDDRKFIFGWTIPLSRFG